MKNIKIMAMAALAAVSLSPITAQTALAQTTPAAQEQDVYAGLYDAMESGTDQQLMLDTMINAVATQMTAGDPRIAAMEEEHPGVVMELVNAIRPVIGRYSERIRAEYRPQMIAAVREVMTEDEAIALTGFYRSDIGQTILQTTSGSIAVGNVTEARIDGEEISADDVSRDMMATGERAFGQLSQEEQATLMREALSTPGFAKLAVLVERAAPIRAAMEAAPPTQEEAAAIVEAVGSVIAQYTQ